MIDMLSNTFMDNKRLEEKKLHNKIVNTKSIDNTIIDNKLDSTKIIEPTDNSKTNIKPSQSDIQLILDKVKHLPIPNDDKVLLMNQFKQNILNPSLNEDINLDHIQNKYLHNKYSNPNPNLYSIQDHLSQQQFTNHQNQQNLQTQYIPHLQYQNQGHGYVQGQSEMMTTTHFEILKNKLDSLQYELIDLLRHVKDYTQRYMNSIRQQDLAKIDEYITGLFDVDKALKETKELAVEADTTAPEPEEDTANKDSVITNATKGITNFMGNLGESVSGITNLVSSTANIANGYLSKPIISGKKIEGSSKSNEVSKTNNAPESKTNTNVVSIDDYINDNAKIETQKNNNQSSTEVEKSKTEDTTEVEKSKTEDTTDKESVHEDKESDQEDKESAQEDKESDQEDKESVQEDKESVQEDKETNKTEPDDTDTEDTTKEQESNTSPANLTNALTELNNKLNKDEDNVQGNGKDQNIKHNNKKNTTNTTIQNGGRYNTLKTNIELLKLKLTKKKLQKELYKNNNTKSKHTKNKYKKNKKNTKHKK